MTVFHMPQKHFSYLKMAIDDHVDDDFKFLGIIIDKHVKWALHAESIANKILNILE